MIVTITALAASAPNNAAQPIIPGRMEVLGGGSRLIAAGWARLVPGATASRGEAGVGLCRASLNDTARGGTWISVCELLVFRWLVTMGSLVLASAVSDVPSCNALATSMQDR